MGGTHKLLIDLTAFYNRLKVVFNNVCCMICVWSTIGARAIVEKYFLTVYEVICQFLKIDIGNDQSAVSISELLLIKILWRKN